MCSMDPYNYLSQILGVQSDFLASLDREMSRATGKNKVLHRIVDEGAALVRQSLESIGCSDKSSPDDIFRGLDQVAVRNENELLKHLGTFPGNDQFEKAVNLAKYISPTDGGFFLKKSRARDILSARPPENVLKHLGYKTVEDMLAHEDVTEVFSALRFLESQAWMHETFDAAYSTFTADDFEDRPIEIKVLGSRWRDVAAQFVAKKHHNVSHLKEFGVIFLNPIAEDLTGKFLRDFALLFHYFHEVAFYAKLFRSHSKTASFAEYLKSLLRGDVLEGVPGSLNEWLIIQRYLWKENPSDPRLFIQHTNPESMHWRRGERDLVKFGKLHPETELPFWENRDWVASIFSGKLVSFDMEDSAMGLVSRGEGQSTSFSYHQREALWTHIFEEYCGGEPEMEKIIMDHYMEGKVGF